jgi:hypothetical protein
MSFFTSITAAAEGVSSANALANTFVVVDDDDDDDDDDECDDDDDDDEDDDEDDDDIDDDDDDDDGSWLRSADKRRRRNIEATSSSSLQSDDDTAFFTAERAFLSVFRAADESASDNDNTVVCEKCVQIHIDCESCGQIMKTLLCVKLQIVFVTFVCPM